MSKVYSGARKIIAGVIGFPLLILGIILIPLPGPGLVVCFLALLVLSSEFEWAAKYYDKARTAIVKLWQDSKDRQQKYIERLEEREKEKENNKK